MERTLSQPIEIFYCYAQADKTLCEKLEINLSVLTHRYNIIHWSDREVLPGDLWKQVIDTHLKKADIILLLISSDFLASDYCYSKEMEYILERHQAGTCSVIPILLRPTNWEGTPFSKIQMLPTNAKPITSWANHDEAFANVVQGIRRVVEHLLSQRAIASEVLPTLSSHIPLKKTKRPSRLPLLFLALLIVCGVVTYSRITYLHSNVSNTHSSRRYIGTSTSISRKTLSNTPSSSPLNASILIPNKPPVLDDPLNGKNTFYGWDTGSQGGQLECFFEDASYHLSSSAGLSGAGCNPQATNTSFANFVYQIKMVISQGQDAQLRTGPDFDWSSQFGGSAYEVTFNSDGDWYFDILTEALQGSDMYTSLLTGTSQYFQTGIGQVNYITIQVLNHLITVQVNGKPLFSIVNGTLSGGQIGMALRPGTTNANVAFNDAKVWQL